MTFVFWQNIISIHQAAFLIELAKKHAVLLLVEQEILTARRNSGWDIPQLVGVEIIIAPSQAIIENIIKSNKAGWHLFSGLHAYKMPTKALKLAVKTGVKNIAIITESYETIGIKGPLRKLKYAWLSYLYKHHIRAIFVTGLPARVCFENLFFDKAIIYDWGYFTQTKVLEVEQQATSKLPKLLFVGTIDKNKNLLSVLSQVLKYEHLFEYFHIVGDGPLISELKFKIKKYKGITYQKALDNDKIQILMKECDLLILPSLYDGWGAVINEALNNGMRVLCSDQCGASVLIDGKIRGSVFSHKQNDFEAHLKYWLHKGVVKNFEREAIIDWSETHISGSVAATYFLKCIAFIEGQLKEKPSAPWIS